MNRTSLFFLICIFWSAEYLAQTVGTVYLSEQSKEKYTLISPLYSTESYLIDNCGFIVNQWSSGFTPGLASYLNSDGNLYRSGRRNSSAFSAGGLGGIIEKYDWSGNLLWQFELANDSLHLHHDFFLKENGNLLLICWEYITAEDAATLGRSLTNDESLYSERIIEIDPQDNFKIVWQWRALDHIVQNTDPNKDDFGDPFDSPRKFDINLNATIVHNAVDWLHINSVEYNSELNLIALSCNAIDEWILIDASTSLSEAASSQGGQYGHGGDILFRWGNPANFMESASDERKLFKQHDVRVHPLSDGNLAFSWFNNGRRKDNLNYSTVDFIDFKRPASVLIESIDDIDLQITDPTWSFNSDADQQLYSKRMSSAKAFEGHWLVCSSDNGHILEIDQNGEVVWEYINPVGPNQIFAQGDIPVANVLFHANAYSSNYFAATVDLSVEPNTIEWGGNLDCMDIISSDNEQLRKDDILWRIFAGTLQVSCNFKNDAFVFGLDGKCLITASKNEYDFCIDIKGLYNGVYLLVLRDSRSGVLKTIRFAKNQW